MSDMDQHTSDFLAVVVENVELRQALADVQEQCIELAVDAGDLHAEVETLRARLAEVEQDRDRWQAQADRCLAG